MFGLSPIPDSPKSAPVSANAHASPSFAFMKDVLSACMKLTSDEIAQASRGGEAYFVPMPKGGVRLVETKEAVPEHAVGIDVEAAIRRSGIFWKNFPNLLPGDVIEHIVLGWSGKEEYDVRYADVKRKEIKVADLLRAAKESFKECDTVGEVTELFAWDRMFVRLEEHGELYSITVKDSSVTVPKRLPDGSQSPSKNLRAAMCEIAYRVKDPTTWTYVEKSLLWIMRLPISKGVKMVFSDKGRVVRELSANPIRKIQLRRSKNETRQ